MNMNEIKAQMLALLKEDDELIELFTQRLERTVLFKELREFREEVNRRFERMDRRFEAMLQELNTMQKELNTMQKELNAMQKELNAMQKELNTMQMEFNAMQKELNAMQKGFETMQQELGAMNWKIVEIHRDLADTRQWVGIVVGGFQVRAGSSLEEAVAGTLRVALNMKDLDPLTIKLRQKIEDTKGIIGQAGRIYEYDIFITDGVPCIFEVKAMPDMEDVDRFADKCELIADKLNLQAVRKVLVTLAKTPELRSHCEHRGVTLA